MALLTILFSAYARKAWASLAGAIVVGAVMQVLGIDISACSGDIERGIGDVLQGGLSALPLGLGALVSTFFVPNKTPDRQAP